MTTSVTTPTLSPDEQAELEQLRARRAELDAAMEAREAEAEAADELAHMRQSVIDAEALQAAIAAEGRLDVKIIALETPLGLVIVRRASALRFQRFQDASEHNTKQLRQLVIPCVVYPPAERFASMCDELPAILVRCGNAIARLAGVRKEELEKK